MSRSAKPVSARGDCKLPPITQENIGMVAEIEEKYLQQRSPGERMGDAVARFSGSMTFFVLNVVWYLAWVLVNTGIVPTLRPFDPYPFTFLTLMVSLEAIFLAIFVLASQNRMARVADQRAHLDLQINLLSEQENSKMLTLLQTMANRMGLKAAKDDEIAQLAEKTEAAALSDELERRLPNRQ
jgi:uncharacterized membrane protein